MANKNAYVEYKVLGKNTTFLEQKSKKRNKKRWLILRDASSQTMGALGEHYADVEIENFTIYPQLFDGVYDLDGVEILADVKTTFERSPKPYPHLDGKQKILAKHGFTFVVVLIHAANKTIETFLLNPNGNFSQADLRKNVNYFAEFTPKEMDNYLNAKDAPRAGDKDITPAIAPYRTPTRSPKKRKRDSKLTSPIRIFKK